MAKRKRESQGSSSVDSGAKNSEGNPEQESWGSAVGREKKRRKLSSTKSTDPADVCAELYDIIRNYRTDDGRVLCESLIRVPKRRSSPEYYEVVSSPIDLLKIQQRLKTDEYEDVETFSQDIELLLENAMKFYKPDSQEYKDAEELKDVFDENKELLLKSKDEVESDNAMEEEDGDEEKGSDTGSICKDKSEKRGKSVIKHTKKPAGEDYGDDDDDDDESSTEGDSSNINMQFFEDMVGAVLEQKDSHGRIISELFKRLPPKDEWLRDVVELATDIKVKKVNEMKVDDSLMEVKCLPTVKDLYELTKAARSFLNFNSFIQSTMKSLMNPLTSKLSAQELGHYYSSVEDLEKDLLLMVKNAHTFNEPGSQVYKDASTIKKLIQTKKAEIDHTVMGAKSSSRLKARRSIGQFSSAVSSLLEEEDEQAMHQAEPSSKEEHMYGYEDYSAHVDEDNGGDDDSDNPLMMLFNEIYRCTDVTGRPLIEPFLRLPSRRAYPDYYEVIKKPIAMMKIRSQIKSGFYETVEALQNEIELCFTNAQTYNEPNSMLYKDAERMLEQAKKKKDEIIKMIEEKGISMEDFLKKKKKFKKSTDQPESRNMEENTGQGLSVVPEIKQMKEMKKKKKVTADGKDKIKKKKGEDVDPLLMKKRMRQLSKAVSNYQDESGRYLSAIFMELPSSEEYPDYYKVISEPVCLSQIESNIKENKYISEEELLLDFEVMFDNARYYNEEDSQVYQDACILEKVLKKKRKALGPIIPLAPEAGVTSSPASAKLSTPTKSGRISTSPGAARKYYQVPSATSELKELCKELMTAVKDCTDMSGRQLCLIFQKLPSRTEYPDYYTLIKKPIDMAKIQSKLNADQYQTLDDFMADLHLMFDNACRYNEPDSQVYKDALSLLRALLRKKAELVGDENKIPDVPLLVQKILNLLYNATMLHVDDEGRCFSDSLLEVSVKRSGSKLTLESIGEILQRGYYKRLDKLQEDLFAIFEKARKISRSDCEMYDDAVELQVFFVAHRDKICKDGERFISPALLVTRRHLLQELDEERKKKAEAELQEDEKVKAKEKKDQKEMASADESGVKELFLGETLYSVGEFVYVEPREEKLQSHVVLIEKLWTDSTGQKWVYGNWYYRPEETFHLATRKFLEKEVFKSDYYSPSKLNKVLGKCHVMTVKDFLKQKPQGFKDEDVFVCESRYSVRTKSFKKIKAWPAQSSQVRMIAREVPLIPRRVPSVFASNEERPAEAVDTDESDESESDSAKNVVLDNYPNQEEGCVYYEQYHLGDVPYKLGDCVYLRSDEDYLYISRIDRLWTDRNGNTWLHGPWFIGPGETQHLPTKMFHEQEVYLSSLEESSLFNSIIGKCLVLSIRDYVRCRPTEIPEKDIYLNEARYDEEEGQFRKLKGLKRYSLSINCYEEEFFYFEEAITPLKVPSPLLFEDQDMMAAGDRSTSPAAAVDTAEVGKRPKKPRSQSAYLLFAYEKRLSLRKEHPEYVFGEISRVIGEEWRNASASVKAEYEAKAQLQLSQVDESAHRSQQLSSSMFVYDCLWRGCDYQYEDLQDLRVHVLDSSNHLKKAEDGLYHCFWSTCTRERRGLRPFNSSAKLFRHCRELHLIGPPRIVAPQDRSKNYFPRHQAALLDAEPDPSPPPPRIPTPSTPASMGMATGGGIGMNQGTSQGIPGTNQYISGRLTPQTMQQAMFSGNNNTSSPFNQHAIQQSTPIMQRQMPMGGSTGINMNNQTVVNQQGQSPSYQQPYNQSQQFNFQQQMSPLNQMSQMNPSQSQVVPQLNPLAQMNQMTQYPGQGASANQHQSQPAQVSTQHVQPQTPVQTPSVPQEVVPVPVFVAPPAKPQRLHHSEAYLRYIEGLRDGNPHMSNWNQFRKPDASSMTPQQIAQLPVHWLGNGYGNYENPVDALWALKEHMLRDALSLSRTSEN